MAEPAGAQTADNLVHRLLEARQGGEDSYACITTAPVHLHLLPVKP